LALYLPDEAEASIENHRTPAPFGQIDGAFQGRYGGGDMYFETRANDSLSDGSTTAVGCKIEHILVHDPANFEVHCLPFNGYASIETKELERVNETYRRPMAMIKKYFHIDF
jgi:hypothetical protein